MRTPSCSLWYQATGDNFVIALSSTSKVFKIDVTLPLPSDPPSPNWNPNYIQPDESEVDDEEAIIMRQEEESSALERAGLEIALIRGERAWAYLKRFCDMEEVGKLSAFRQDQEPGMGGEDKGKGKEDEREETEELLRPPPTATHIAHISAHFNHFCAYSVSAKEEESLVLMGSKETDAEGEPQVLKELQGMGVIK